MNTTSTPRSAGSGPVGVEPESWGQQILIVDDRKENLFALKNVLQEVDAEVVTASSGNEALRLSLSHDFALAILDVQMPGMDGYELADLLRSDERTERLPIIFLSAIHRDQVHVFRGFAAGAVDYITKPFEPTILLGKVKVFLALDQQKRELLRRVELEEAKSRLENILLSMAEAVVVVSSELRVETVNAAASSLLGYGLNELVGRSLMTFMPDGGSVLGPIVDPSGLSEPSGRGIAPVERRSSELVENLRRTWRGKEGREIPVLLSCSAFHDAMGVTIGAVLVARDLTEITRVQEEHRQVQEEYSQVLKTALDGFWVCDARGKLLEVNDTSAEMSGYSREELLGMSISELAAADSADETASRLAQVVVRGHDRYESRHRRKDGSFLEVEVSLTHNPDVGRIYVFIRDRTDKRRSEDLERKLGAETLVVRRLQELDRLKAGFVETVTHELRTPMTPLRSAVEMFLDGTIGEVTPPQRNMLEMMNRNVQRLARFATDVLALSRIDAGNYPLLPETIELRETLAPILDLLRSKVEERGGSLDLLVGPETGGFADPDAFAQVVTNLVNNAIAHTANATRICVTARTLDSGFVEVGVADDGQGIPSHSLNKIFDRFFQADRKSGPGYKGTGIGLTVCKNLVERMGGCITVDSRIGEGTTFRFTLPTERVSHEILFGRIAYSLGCATNGQIREALDLQQASEGGSRKMGDILVDNGHTTNDERESVLRVQAANLDAPHPYLASARLGDALLGRLAVSSDALAEETLYECLRTQRTLKEAGEELRLGEIFVQAGHMSAAKVLALLKTQGRHIIACAECDSRFNACLRAVERLPLCPRCGTRLLKPEPGDEIAVNADLE